MIKLVSVIVPTKEINPYITDEIIPALNRQTFKKLELIIVPDRFKQKGKFPSWVKIIPSWPKTGPAEKRDLGVSQAKGEVIAFLDDDAWPEKNWLKSALGLFKNSRVAAVCGPGLTPPTDNLRQQVSGWVWRSWLGAGGAGTYRCYPKKTRQVDDYPAFNLLVRKKDFNQVGGFDSRYWPGEDTQLCHALVYQLSKKIIYDPRVLVYHHRRPVFISHLRQISRFGLHRGHFARILPKTSLRIGYLFPPFFVLGIILGPILIALSQLFYIFYLTSIAFYFLALMATAIDVYIKERKPKLALLVMPAIIATHLIYGIFFIKGLFCKQLLS